MAVLSVTGFLDLLGQRKTATSMGDSTQFSPLAPQTFRWLLSWVWLNPGNPVDVTGVSSFDHWFMKAGKNIRASLLRLSGAVTHSFFNFIFIYFWLCWIFVAVRGLSLVAVSGGHSSLRSVGFSLQWLLLLRSTGSRRAGLSSCSTRSQ